MRLLHTADWHLGRLLHAHSLIEDQAHLLDQLIGYARNVRPDAIVVAGDVYDRSVPGPEAVALLDHVLSELVLGLRIPVIMIAGNHDSGERLGFGARLLAAAGLHIAGRPGQPVEAIPFATPEGPVHVYPLPYAEPGEVRSRFGLPEPIDHASAMALQLDAIRARHPPGARAVLVAHAFVVGAEESESERPLSVGGTGAIEAAVFAGFDYVALGHLHRPQTLAGGRLRYAGSPLKYSLSEVDHCKSLTLAELDGDGRLQLSELPFTPLHALHILEGSLAEVCAARPGVEREDYVLARLTDRGALLDPMNRLRAVYPNALGVQRLVLDERGSAAERGRARGETTPAELFASFFEEVTGVAPDDAQRAAFGATLGRVQGQDAVPANEPPVA